jgi:hypothetical protein
MEKIFVAFDLIQNNNSNNILPEQVSVTLRELGLDHPDGYHITDLYDDYDYGIVTPERRFKVDVNPSGSKFCLLSMGGEGDTSKKIIPNFKICNFACRQ